MDPTHALVPVATSLPDLPPAARLVDAFLSGRTPATVRSYAGDLRDFARVLGVGTPAEASARLLGTGQGGANLLALDYRSDLLRRGLAAATVNRRLAALRSLVQLGRVLGVVTWHLEVEGVRSQAYRDTSGPGRTGFRQLLDQLAGRPGPKGARDRAIVRLLYDLALRREEVCRLDVTDYDRERGTLAVRGKGRTEKEPLTLPTPTRAALDAWLAERPAGAEALFVALDHAHRGHRLTGQAVYALVRGLGDLAGLRARPHGLRHAAVTAALDATGGDVRRVARFSRHKKVETLLIYDDRRRDAAGDIAQLVAGEAA
jgi:integrase/recombinase XerC